MSMRADVLVVGAGPAGGTAARYAAAKGAKVTIIERRPEVGVPVRYSVSSVAIDSKEYGVDVDMHDKCSKNLDGEFYSADWTIGKPGADVLIFWGPLSEEEAKEDIIAGNDVFILNERLLHKLLPGGMVDHTQGNDGTLDDCDAPHFHAEGSDAHIFVPDPIKKRLRYHVARQTN